MKTKANTGNIKISDKNGLRNGIIKKVNIAAMLILFSSLSFAQGDTWTRVADFGGTATINAVGFSIHFAISGKGYVGARNDGGLPTDFWEYDPGTDTWTQLANFPGQPRQAAVGFSIGNKGYIGTGRTGPGTLKKDFWEYDPATDTWTQKTDFGGSGRWLATSFSTGTHGYIGTGLALGIGVAKDFWKYDPVTDTWTQIADLGGVNRFLSNAFSIDGNGYVGTGISFADTPLKDFWKYDPATYNS